MTPFAIHVYGSAPHQRGHGSSGESVRSATVASTRNPDEDGVNPNGEVKWLVRDGKPLNARGRELLRKPS